MSDTPAKPVIFFSHSTKDEAYLKRLKELFVARTNGMIDVFLSCDGESIRYGSNWSYKIEEEAKNCRLMFAFLSPHSIASKWLYFETGFALARDKDVVPIGIHGVSPGEVGPPLSLLHGFRLHSTDTLNNIVAVINQHFGSNYEPVFTTEDYDSLVATALTATSGPFGEFNPFVSRVEVDLSTASWVGDDSQKRDTVFGTITDVLSSLHIKCEYQSGVITCLGMRAFAMYPEHGQIRFAAAPASLGATFSQLKEIVKRVGDKLGRRFAVQVVFEPNVYTLSTSEQITGRLMPLGIGIEKDGYYSLGNVCFKAISHYATSPDKCQLRVLRKDSDDLSLNDVVNVVRQFWIHGLLYTAD